MYRMPSREEIQYLREVYPPGTRVKLLSMTDPQAVPPGTMGTIIHIDSIGQAVMKWDNGRSLSLVIGEDRFEVCREEPKHQSEKPKGKKKDVAR